MEAIIKGKNIVKTFGKGAEQAKALAGVDVEIGKGEFVAVMGSSGSGKPTLLFALSGMDTITSGSVKFEGVELAELGENKPADTRRSKMGFVFQQPTMLKNLNLPDNIILPAAQDKKKTEGLVKKAKMLMEKTGISGLEARDTTEVSGGRLQRDGICRALMNEPEILFADEPTGALNSKSAEEIMGLPVDINREGTAILLVTHDAKVDAGADRVLFMKDGNIVSDLPLDKFGGGDMETVYSLTEDGAKKFKSLMFEIARSPINIFLDFNAVIVNLESLPPESQRSCLTDIEDNVRTLKAYLVENIAAKETMPEIPKTGMAVLQQQLILAQTIETWIVSL